jgi:outer membrane protein TolC
VIEHQYKIIHARNLPKTNLFVQGGYGKPSLNFLENKFDWFYIGGIRVNWSLSGLYTRRKELANVEWNRKMVDLQKETFLLNTNTMIRQQKSEIEKLEGLVASDKEIIQLRTSIKDAAKAQLQNAVITANDYLREVNAEDLARQALITHQLQLLQAEINYQTILGE